MSSSSSAFQRTFNATEGSPSNAALQATKDSSSPPKKSLNFSNPAQSFVTIHCKGAAEPFRIHKNVITHYSPFFSAAFNSNFKEGKTQTMHLGDVEARIFGYFNNWLYVKRFEAEEGTPLQTIEYAKLWSLAQRFLMPDLQTTLLNRIEESMPSLDSGTGNTLKDLQRYAYATADQQLDSGLKNLAIKKTLSTVNQDNIDEVLEGIPKGMLMDFTRTLLVGCTRLQGWEFQQGVEGVATKMESLASIAQATLAPLTYGEPITSRKRARIGR